MKLSCIVLMCDKDFKFIPKLIQNINNKVKIEHEIIVIDNREVYINEIIDTGNAIVKSQGHNLRQMESRKWAIEFATGDYIWFIDGDDDIKEVQEQEQTADIVCFNFVSDGDKYTNTYYGENTINGNLLDGALFSKIGAQLWNKWLKTDLVKRVYALTPDHMELSSLEDFTATALSLKLATSLQHINDVYYIYHVDNSSAMKDSYTNADQFRSFMVGHNLAHCILSENFTSQEKVSLGIINLYQSCCLENIQKYLRCIDSIKKDCLQILQDTYSKEIILETMVRLYPYQKTLEELIDLLKETEKIFNEIEQEQKELYGIEPTTINTLSRRVSFTFHRICNKKCVYCNTPQKPQSLCDDDIYKNFDNALTKLEEMTNGNLLPQVLGGEPSLWSEYLQKKIVERLSVYPVYNVYTNGTNMESPICSAENAMRITHIIDWNNKELPQNKRNELYAVVVMKNEIDLLDNFLSKNKGREFSITPCSNSGNSDYDCTKRDAMTIRDILKKHDVPTYFNIAELCNKKNTVWQVDCNTNEIRSCCQTKEKQSLKDFSGDVCTSCDDCIVSV